MQMPFYTEYKAVEFSKMNNEIFLPALKKCPFRDFAMPVELKKHGYYKSFFISYIDAWYNVKKDSFKLSDILFNQLT